MGIRFYCPNGHKLHVKDFQAGRRGICPHCGVSMDIPLTSTRESSKKRARDAASVEGDGSGVVHVDRHDDEPISLEEHATHFSEAAASLAASSAGSPSATPAAAATASRAATAEHPAESAPKRGPSSIPAPGTPPGAPAHSPRRPADPLDEVPTAVWYVRPPSGGQFGPATRDVMRAWLAEGRVSADSLVWREGWRDWNTASEVFPQFSPSVKTPPHLDFLDDEIPRSTTSARKSPAAGAPAQGKPDRPRKSKWLWIGIACGALLVLGAIGLVVYVSR